ncbi:MAG: hypothetical protein QOE06_3150 [Thermoleophilaceae bacterium]|nr:hypothetical protein [Thermoleophilaceae bacterium]
MPAASEVLSELASVPWRRRAGAASLRTRGRIWKWFTVVYVAQWVAVAALLLALNPMSAPVAAVGLAMAWIVPNLYAARGATTLRPKGPRHEHAEPLAQGFLGDLLGHDEREIQRHTGLAVEPGRLGTWVVGERGAALVTDGGRRVHCFCIRTTDPELPPSDRIAHLLLALRTDEEGFATVANHTFAGAPWRLSRRIDRHARPALAAAQRRT